MECKRGVWFTAAASPKLLLKEVEHGQGPSFWHELMTLLGGKQLGLVWEKGDGACSLYSAKTWGGCLHQLMRVWGGAGSKAACKSQRNGPFLILF